MRRKPKPDAKIAERLPPVKLSDLAVLGESRLENDAASGYVPHVVAWNLTSRCNLQCAHCYISAGPSEEASGELSTEECLRIADEILELNPSPMFILSGGEPLLRDDLCQIALHASSKGATVVVGTNGTLLTKQKINDLQNAGVTGVAVSVDSLNPRYHDRFRHGDGSLQATLDAVDRLRQERLDFVVQTTVTTGNRSELRRLVEWSADRGAVSFNAYFLVATGRGAGMGAMSADENETVLTELVDLHGEYRGQMMVRAKCAPQFMRLVSARMPDSPVLSYSTRCPCGVQYCRVTPDGKLTPCPYMPVAAGDLRTQSFSEIWNQSELFRDLREGGLGGRCGQCAYRKTCGGCRARAFALEGDPLGEDPGCSYHPDGMEEAVLPPPVAYGTPAEQTLEWTPEAEERVKKIPSFVRGVVVSRLEAFARRRGLSVITPELMQEVRREMPIDFSKRLPFFLRND